MSPSVPNPRDAQRNAQSTNGSIFSIPSSDTGGTADSSFMEDRQLPQLLAPLAVCSSPLPPSQENSPPSRPEGASTDNVLYLQHLDPQSITSTPTPSTAMSALADLDTFVHVLTQELLQCPNVSVKFSVKQNENVHDGSLELYLEQEMNVQLSIIPPAADQRIILPVPLAAFTGEACKPKPLFLSLVIAGEITRRIFGGVGVYHPNQSTPELLHIIEDSNFSPALDTTSGRIVSTVFKFTKYPRQCDPSEEAFRVIATLHDSGGKLVAYSLSASAYSVKSHPRNTKWSLQASTDEPEDTGLSRTNRNCIFTASPTLITRNHTLFSSSSTAGSSDQQQSGRSTDTGGHPGLEPTVDRSVETLTPMTNPQVHSLLREPCGVYPAEEDQPMPTLDEAVPPSCCWHGGIVLSLFVNNLPQDGPIYARFGYHVVKTDRKAPGVLVCRVPAAVGPCEVEVTLSRGSGPLDAPYGTSLCTFTYEEDDIMRLVRSLKAEAQSSNSFEWQAAAAIQEHTTRNRLIPSRSRANQSINDQSASDQWSLASHARLGVVEQVDENENDADPPQPSKPVPDLDIISHGPSDMEGECSNCTGVESVGSAERSVWQDMKTLDAVALHDSENHTTLRTISKPNVSLTPELKKLVMHNIVNSPSSETQHSQQARHTPACQVSSRNTRTSQPPLERALPIHSQHLNLHTDTSSTDLWKPTITAQQLPTTTLTSLTPGFSAVDPTYGLRFFTLPYSPPLEVSQGIDLNHVYSGAIHPSYHIIRLKCVLKSPKGYQENSKVIVRGENRVVLDMRLQAVGGRLRDMGWQGIALPRTGSVNQSNQQTPAKLLYFSIEVHGSITGMTLTQPCNNCWRRKLLPIGNPPGPSQYHINFESHSPVILFPRTDTLPYVKADVMFHFTCYSNHQKEDYELVARLHDEEGNLVTYYQLPYSFRSVAQPDGDGLQDDYPSIVPLAVGPVAVAMPPGAGPSTVLHPSTSTRRKVSAPSQRPAQGGHLGASVHRPRPPLQHPSQLESVEAQSDIVGVRSRTDTQRPEAHDQPRLSKIIPIEGPTRGGLNVVLIGTNLPPWPTTIYARFGTAVAATSWINPYTLECPLPTSAVLGSVDVTLSLSPDHDAPQLGRSVCTFTYREEQDSFLLMLRSIYSQGHELSRVALDTLIQQVLQHTSLEALNHAVSRLAQSPDSLPPIDDRELEEMGVRFLASISDSPHWNNDLSVADENHQTIAHLCVLSGYTRLLTKVVDWGIDLDVQDVSGLTALHFAYLRETWDYVRILKDAGAKEHIKDKLGRIPRDMCQCISGVGTASLEWEAASTQAQCLSGGEEDWVNVPSRVSASQENLTLLGIHPMLRLPWGSPGDLKAVDGIRASLMPIPGPPSEDSSIADDESWASAFSNLQISDSPPPLARAPSSVASLSSRRGVGASRYGRFHRMYSPSTPGVRRKVSSAASAKFYSLPATSSFNPLPAFQMPQPVVPPFLDSEPTGYPEEIDNYTSLLSRQPSSQQSSPRTPPSPTSRHHNPEQSSPLDEPRVPHSNLFAVSTKQRLPQSIQQSHSAPRTRYAPPPGPPPPPDYASLDKVVPSS